MSFRRYPKNHDSGVQWLGDVPEHWELRPLFGLVRERAESNKGMVEDNLLSLSYGRIIRKDIASNDGLLPQSFETYQVVRPGDIILRLTDLQNDKRSLRSALVEETGIITAAYLAVIPQGPIPNFLSYLLRAYDVTKVFYSMGGGLRQSMNFGDVKRMPTLVPPEKEQAQIVKFLDHETSKIDGLIREQRQLMELLKEKRQAVISHAVTKGLNPGAPMKPSVVAWLGDTPAHWKVRRLKYVSPQITVGIVVEPSKYYVPDGIPALRSLNVSPGSVTMASLVFISTEANDLHAKSKLRAGDLVVVRSGQPGTTAVIPPELDGCNCIDLIIIRKPLSGSEWFLCWYLSSDAAVMQFAVGSGGAIQQHFNVGTAAELFVPVPPVQEQKAIVEYIQVESAKLDILKSEAQNAIDLLLERRSALIFAAVTGKIDVRALAKSEAA
jgi:type I restriction enzyme S subunit